jgi:hypothetical protein
VGSGFDDNELRQVFAETASMVRFFEDRSGVPFPEVGYSQALVTRTIGQEMAGLSILSDDYGRAVLADPTQVSLIAHELAHQWWGNMVTCETWTEFWLNEGFATFMAAAYREQRFGREVTPLTLRRAMHALLAVRDKGQDKSLVFASWDRPSADDCIFGVSERRVSSTCCEKPSEIPLSGRVFVNTRQGNFGKSVTTVSSSTRWSEEPAAIRGVLR